MPKTNRDNLIADLRQSDLMDTEVRALLCHVVRTCAPSGVARLRAVVVDEEPVFYVTNDSISLA
jgi:hypothetical protein